MTTSLQCQLCKHYRGAKICAAFPVDIPEEIFLGQHDHREPFPGDNGILFEPLEKKEDKDTDA